MPNSKQAQKRMRQNEEARVQNKAVKSSMRSAIKRVLAAPSKDEAEKHVPAAMRRIDKAAKKNVIHHNAAARYKNRLARNVAGKG